MSAQSTDKGNTKPQVSILFLALQGYTAMMHENEEHALSVIQYFNKVVKRQTQRTGGSIIQNMAMPV